MITNRKAFSLIFVGVLGIVMICWFLDFILKQWLTSQPPEPVVIETFSIESTSDGFSLLWEKEDVYVRPFIGLGDGGIPLTTNDDELLLYGNIGYKPEVLHIEFISMEDGTVDKKPKAVNQRVSSIYALNGKLYMSVDGTQKISGTTRWGASQIVALDTETGKQLWATKIPGSRSIQRMIVSNNTISVDGSFSDNYYVLDSQTGNILKEIDKNNTFFWFEYEGLVFEEPTPNKTFLATDSTSNEFAWESSFYPIYQSPTLESGVLLAKLGTGAGDNGVVALEAVSGAELWRYPRAIGTVALSEDVAYFLTPDLILMAKELHTGQTLGEVQFTPNYVSDSTHNAYGVAATNGMVAVYLGDTRQLFAFEFEE